jgi:hypothetical protein
MSTPEQRIRDVYGFDFPPDFFEFRKFLAGIPEGLLSRTLEMGSAHPFAVADGKAARDFPNRPLWEDRAHNDPPEFITIFGWGGDGLHWGYYFDDPADGEVVVAHYYANDAFQFGTDGDDLFEAVRSQVEYCHTEYERDIRNGYEVTYCQDQLKALAEVRSLLTAFWEDRPEIGKEYRDVYGVTWRGPVAETRDDMGIVVPRALYRPLPGEDRTRVYNWDPTPAEVEAMAGPARELLREGFPGAALKLGKDLWVYREHRATSYEMLEAAYAALGRTHLLRLLAEVRAFREHCG